MDILLSSITNKTLVDSLILKICEKNNCIFARNTFLNMWNPELYITIDITCINTIFKPFFTTSRITKSKLKKIFINILENLQSFQNNDIKFIFIRQHIKVLLQKYFNIPNNLLKVTNEFILIKMKHQYLLNPNTLSMYKMCFDLEELYK